MALLGREGVGGVLYHLGEVVPGADAEVGVVVDAGFGVGGRPLPILSARRTGKLFTFVHQATQVSPRKVQKHIQCFF
jgi:hypothetical protein